MEYIMVTKENLEEEHICCAISNNRNFHNTQRSSQIVDGLSSLHQPAYKRGFTIDDTLMTHIASEYFFYYN